MFRIPRYQRGEALSSTLTPAMLELEVDELRRNVAPEREDSDEQQRSADYFQRELYPSRTPFNVGLLEQAVEPGLNSRVDPEW